MGTNYYLHKDVCKCCKKAEEVLHIGKSSYGWYFSLHVIPDENINNLDDWIELFKEHTIKSEYGDDVFFHGMISTIIDRSSKKDWDNIDWGGAFNYKSEEDFHRCNHSQRGINGLAKPAIDGTHCIGHGEGAYSYILGEFS